MNANLEKSLREILDHLEHENYFKRSKTSDREEIIREIKELKIIDMLKRYDAGEDPFWFIQVIVESALRGQPEKKESTLSHEAFQNARLKIAFECIGGQQLFSLFRALIPNLDQMEPMTNVEYIHVELPNSDKRKDFHYGQPDILKHLDGIYLMIEMKVRGKRYYDAGQLCKYLNLADQERRKEEYQNSSFIHLILKPTKRTNIFYKLGEKWIDQEAGQLNVNIVNAAKASKVPKWRQMLLDNRKKYMEYLKFIPIYQRTYTDILETFESLEYENKNHYNSIKKQLIAIQ